ncbi:hypothetical protein GCM10009563_18980 [Subtercola frigoramans]
MGGWVGEGVGEGAPEGEGVDADVGEKDELGVGLGVGLAVAAVAGCEAPTIVNASVKPSVRVMARSGAASIWTRERAAPGTTGASPSVLDFRTVTFFHLAR